MHSSPSFNTHPSRPIPNPNDPDFLHPPLPPSKTPSPSPSDQGAPYTRMTPSPLVLQPNGELADDPPSPISPLPPQSGSGKERGKKPNPLVDLIDSEKIYVDSLAGIIRKVASAWSRDNLPPPELDTMFRGVEGVFRANRSLLAKLKEIGPNPASPKALGDLLMRWIDDLEPPYMRYCTAYTSSFDSWDPVQSNPNLRGVLEELSSSVPPPSGHQFWSMDLLFGLPRVRLKYYKKLYARLLKSTQAGRSDHKLLVGANEKLDNLMEIIDSRREVRVGDDESHDEETPPSQKQGDSQPSSSGDPEMRSRGHSRESSEERIRIPPLKHSPSRDLMNGSDNFKPPSFPSGEGERTSAASSNADSSGSSGRMSRDTEGRSRTSRDTVSTSITDKRPSSISPADLERRLCTDRVLDIFSLAPKYCKLQMNPPNLPFTRTVRFSADCVVLFTPKATGVEIVHRRAHIFLLTDLFLICEWMLPEEKASVQSGPDGPDLWLRYPPLAGKHLLTSDVSPPSDIAFQVQIMKKETIVIVTESRQMKESMMHDFQECADLAANLLGPIRSASIAGGPKSPLPRSSSAPLLPGGPSHDSGQTRDSSASQPNTSQSQTTSPRNSDADSFASRPPSGPAPYIPPPRGVSKGALNPLTNPPARGASLGPNSGPPSPSGQPPRSPFSQSHSLQDTNGPPPAEGAPQGAMPNGIQPGGIMPNRPPPNGMVQNGPPPRGASLPSHMSPQFPPQQQNPRQLQDPRSPPPDRMGQPLPPPPQDRMGQALPPPPLERLGQPLPPPPMQQQHDPNGRVLRKSPSGRSIASQYPGNYPPPIPNIPPYANGPHPQHLGLPQGPFSPRDGPSVHFPPPSPSYPPRSPFPGGPQPPQFNPRAVPNPNSPYSHSLSTPINEFDDVSPPVSPVDDDKPKGPVTSVISAQMKCKVFLQQQHAQWKSLGGAKLKLYQEEPTNVKQLVVEADTKDKPIMISTIVLSDGVERVGKTGVAIELSDQGARTGIICMIQLKNETSAMGLFDSLLRGTDRARS